MKELQERLIILGTVFVIVTGVLTNIFVKAKEARASQVPEFRGSWSCIADTQICPDGHSVMRVGPYCHFAPCD